MYEPENFHQVISLYDLRRLLSACDFAQFLDFSHDLDLLHIVVSNKSCLRGLLCLITRETYGKETMIIFSFGTSDL